MSKKGERKMIKLIKSSTSSTVEAKRICENILFSVSDEYYAELAERMEQ